MGPLLGLAAASTAMSIYGSLSGASANKKAASARAASLSQQARRRLEKGQMDADVADLKGGADRTSYIGETLSRGGSRQAITTDLSLDEISNRAKFAHDQALSDAKFEADNILADAGALTDEAKSLQKAAYIGSFGTILGAGNSYFTGKYGPDAYKMGWKQLLS